MAGRTSGTPGRPSRHRRTRRAAGSPRPSLERMAPGTAVRNCASISALGSTAVTRCPSATSERVSFPVPRTDVHDVAGDVAREPAGRIVRVAGSRALVPSATVPNERARAAKSSPMPGAYAPSSTSPGRSRMRNTGDRSTKRGREAAPIQSAGRVPSPHAAPRRRARAVRRRAHRGVRRERRRWRSHVRLRHRRARSISSRALPSPKGVRSTSTRSRTGAATAASRDTSSRRGSCAEPLPAVVYLHGSGGDRAQLLPLASTLAERGAVALTLTLPSGSATPPSGVPPEETLRWQRDQIIGDVVAVRRGLDLLAEDERVDPDRLGLVGWSFGGRLGALLAGVDDRIRATALMSAGAAPVSEYVAAAPPDLRDDVEEVLTPIDPLTRIGDARATSFSRRAVRLHRPSRRSSGAGGRGAEGTRLRVVCRRARPRRERPARAARLAPGTTRDRRPSGRGR